MVTNPNRSDLPEEPAKSERGFRRAIAMRYLIAGLGIGMIVTVCCCANVMTPALFSEGPGTSFKAVIVGSLIGAAIAQINLIAMWAALSAGSWIVRLPWALLLTLAMTSSFGVGIRADGGSGGDVMLLLAIFAMAVIVAQIPFRCVKWFRGRQLTLSPAVAFSKEHSLKEQPSRERPNPEASAEDSKGSSTEDSTGASTETAGQPFSTNGPLAHDSRAAKGQFGIASLMFATALLAISLALFRQAFPTSADWSFLTTSIQLGKLWLVLGPVVLANMVFVAPAVWFAFRDQHHLGRTVLLWFPFVLLFTGIQFAFYIIAFGSPGRDGFASFVTLVAINASQSVMVFVVISILRRLGFTLDARQPSDTFSPGVPPAAKEPGLGTDALHRPAQQRPGSL